MHTSIQSARDVFFIHILRAPFCSHLHCATLAEHVRVTSENVSLRTAIKHLTPLERFCDSGALCKINQHTGDLQKIIFCLNSAHFYM